MRTGLDGDDTPTESVAISGTTISDNIIENFAQSGIVGDNGALGASSDNLITNNLVENISADTGSYFGYAIALYDNFYATVTNNVITGSQNALQVENFFLPDPDAGPSVDLVSGNTVDFLHRGIFLNLQYETASPWTFSNNSITADPAATGTTKGISVESVQGTVSETLTNNNVTGATYGVELWNLPTTGTVTVSGGTLSQTSYGIWASNDAEYGFAGASSAVISGVSIPGASTAGIYVQGDTGAGTAPVAITVSGDTEISGSPTGILVSGGNASADITGNDASISGNSIGIDVDGGSATISGNHIVDNATGIQFTGGGSGSVSDDNFGGATSNGTDLLVTAGAGNVTIGDGNALRGSTDYIQNLSGENFDLSNATANTFGGFNAAETAWFRRRACRAFMWWKTSWSMRLMRAGWG